MEQLIKEIQSLQLDKEQLEKQAEELKLKISEMDKNIEDKKASLIEKMDSSQKFETEVDDLNATIFAKENVGYKDENAVIVWLKQNCQSDYIKVKTTESIDKTALKKAIKTNEDLAKDLEQFIDKSVTRYVVVTTKENHEKMLEHINK